MNEDTCIKPEILTSQDAIREVKDCGSQICNYRFPEFEVHLNQLPPRAAQEWHYHRQIEEIVVVNSGCLTFCWLEGDEYRETPVEAGSLVRVKGSVHNFENRTDETVSFTVFRMVPDGEDKSSIIKQDRTLVEG